MAQADPSLLGDDEFDGLYGHVSQKNGLCMAASGRSLDLALARMDWALTLMASEEAEKEKKKKKKARGARTGRVGRRKSKDQSNAPRARRKRRMPRPRTRNRTTTRNKTTTRSRPKSRPPRVIFLTACPNGSSARCLADLVAHEVGHTLGLRHNFKASSLLTLDEINSDEVKGKKTITASVMDYTPINYRLEAGSVQGDYAMIDIGPYDFWAIEYGYTFEDKKLPEILKRCSEPELQYATDEDTSGPDPLARRYDFSKDPLDYAQEQMKLDQPVPWPDPGQVCQGRRQLGQGPSRLRADPQPADSCCRHDGQLGRRCLRQSRQEG